MGEMPFDFVLPILLVMRRLQNSLGNSRASQQAVEAPNRPLVE